MHQRQGCLFCLFCLNLRSKWDQLSLWGTRCGFRCHSSDPPKRADLECDHNDLGGILPSLDPDTLKDYFRNMCNDMVSLKALATAASLYESFPGATIPLGISGCALDKSSWIPKPQERNQTSSSRIYRLNRPQKFSCLALFESGSCDLRPDELEHVMAMSVGNGLYIRLFVKRSFMPNWPLRYTAGCGQHRTSRDLIFIFTHRRTDTPSKT